MSLDINSAAFAYYKAALAGTLPGGGGGAGDASAANQVTGNTRLGDLTETAPANDTASSGLNGRLQRIAQRLTSLIALFSNGAGTAAGAIRTTYASDGATVPVSIQTLGINTNAAATLPNSLAGLAVNAFTRLYNAAAGAWSIAPGDSVNGMVVQTSASEWETVAASQTDQILGATGAVGDLLDSVLVIPVTTTPGAIDIKDGNGTAIRIFEGGASSVSNLVPFSVPLGLKCLNATTPGWKITTGANVRAVGIGNFT